MAHVFGLDAVTAAYGNFKSDGTGTAGQNIGTAAITDSADVEELMNEQGELIGAAVRNHRQELAIDWNPIGVRTVEADGSLGGPVSGKNALDNAIQGMKVPGVWSKVTLSGLPESATPTLNWNGDWIYKGGASVNTTSDGVAQVSMTLERPVPGEGPMTVDELVKTAT
jgi:hypothetical protein